jgi:hypothetical protein
MLFAMWMAGGLMFMFGFALASAEGVYGPHYQRFAVTCVLGVMIMLVTTLLSLP